MKNNNILIAFFTVVAAASCAMAKGGTIGNLEETSNKISSIDMNKNDGETGKVLNGFYTGMALKKEGSAAPVVYMTPGSRTLAQAEKEVCNAKPAKTLDLAAKVPALDSGTGKTPEKKNTISADTLPSRTDALQIGQKGTYLQDLDTVIDFVTGTDVSQHVKDKLDSIPPNPACCSSRS